MQGTIVLPIFLFFRQCLLKVQMEANPFQTSKLGKMQVVMVAHSTDYQHYKDVFLF